MGAQEGICKDGEHCSVPPRTCGWVMALALPGDGSSPVARAGQRRESGLQPSFLMSHYMSVGQV